MQIRIARNNGAAEFPCRLCLHQFGPNRIRQDVEAHTRKRALLPFLFTQDMVMRLRLEFPFALWLRS